MDISEMREWFYRDRFEVRENKECQSIRDLCIKPNKPTLEQIRALLNFHIEPSKIFEMTFEDASHTIHSETILSTVVKKFDNYFMEAFNRNLDRIKELLEKKNENGFK